MNSKPRLVRGLGDGPQVRAELRGATRRGEIRDLQSDLHASTTSIEPFTAPLTHSALVSAIGGISTVCGPRSGRTTLAAVDIPGVDGKKDRMGRRGNGTAMPG